MPNYNPFSDDDNPFDEDKMHNINHEKKNEDGKSFNISRIITIFSFVVSGIFVVSFIFSYINREVIEIEDSTTYINTNASSVSEQTLEEVSLEPLEEEELITNEKLPIELISEIPEETSNVEIFSEAELLDQNLIVKKTVQVVVEDCDSEEAESGLGTSVGSGVLINWEGYIISNSHIFENCFGQIYIATANDVDTPTEINYIAEIIHNSPELDLVLLKIRSFANGDTVTEHFKFFDLSSTDELSLGETVQIWGYPTARGDGKTYSLQINLTKGTISGFESDNSFKRGWIVTDADISYGNSGGAALDEVGRLVGIPTFGRTEGASWLGYLRSADVLKSWLENVFPEFFSIPTLTIKENEISNIPRYNRDDWNSWIDSDGDCQNTRHENLQFESFIEVNFTNDSNCYVSSGKWFDPFNGIYLYEASEIDIDHFVPLYNVHISGGWAWSEEKKTMFANNLNDPDILIAVESGTNREKSAHAPDKWKPANTSYWCEYAYDWIRIKYEWELSVTQEEWNALEEMLDTCPYEFLYEDAKNKSHLFSEEKISKYSN